MTQTKTATPQSPTKVVTGLVRFSYAHLNEPYSNEEGKEKKYSTAILIPKTDKLTLGRIERAVEAAIEQGKSKWGGKVPPASKLKKPLRDGDEEKPDDPNYAGMMFLNCSSKQKPGIVDANRQQILDADEIYSGMYGFVSLNFFPYDSNGSKGVGAGLNNVMKAKDGEKLGGGSSAEEDFAEISVEGWKAADDADDILG